MRITGFRDFRADRAATAKLAAKATVDLLWYLDAAGGDADHTGNPDPDYLAFRDWFAQRTHETTLGLVSQLLGSIDVDRGTVSFGDYHAPEAPVFDRLAARLEHLIEEIPELQERYGQLFPDEVDPMLEDVNSAAILDLEVPADRLEATRLLGELERWYAFAQQGMRLFRNDADERARFDEYLDELRASAEAERKAVEAVAETGEGTEEQRAEARERLQREKAAAENEIQELQEHLAGVRAGLAGILGRLDRLRPRETA